MLARISSRELTEWEAYEVIAGPIGDDRLDHLFAMLQAVIANGNRGKRQRPFEIKQFLPQWGRAKQRSDAPMDGYQLLDRIKKINRQMGGGVEHGDTR